MRTELVENKVPVFVALDPKLTAPVPEPVAPKFNCSDVRTGRPTVCHGDLLNYVDRLRSWGRKTNGKLKEIQDLQPEPAP